MLSPMKFAHEIVADLKKGLYSVEKITQEALARAEAVQKDLNAFITMPTEQALERAKSLDKRLANGEDPGPLTGVPVVIKDNICTKGIRTTAASKSLEHFVPPYNATVIERLEHSGAIVIAKSNLDEFGMGGSNENSAFGPVKNAWNPDFVAGGSSGGSAVAVAAGVAPIAIGTDTGGSVRLPAAFNGVIGFKPTYGRLSRYGVIAYASSLDQVGVVCKSAKDLALVMNAMSGHDPQDSTSIQDYPQFYLPSSDNLKGLRIGIIDELSAEGNTEGVLAALTKMKETLESLGASVSSVSLPTAPAGIAAYYLVAPAEASSNLARYDAMVYSSRLGENNQGQANVMMKSRGSTLGPEVRRRILMGTYALSAGYYDAYYGKALKVRRLIANDFEKAFANFDLLMTPTVPSTAYRFGEKSDPLAMYLVDKDAVLANLVGLPAVSVPAGKAENDMPCGVQFLAPALQDEKLIGLTGVLEQALGESFAPLAKSKW